MNDNYPKAYKEVIEILECVPSENLNLIPKTMIEMFKTKMDKEYEFSMDINKRLEEQELLQETKAILANIYRDYWATPIQKQSIVEKEKQDRIVIENKKREKYNPNDIFKKKTVKNECANPIQSNLPIEVKQGFFERIIFFIKNLFKK